MGDNGAHYVEALAQAVARRSSALDRLNCAVYYDDEIFEENGNKKKTLVQDSRITRQDGRIIFKDVVPATRTYSGEFTVRSKAALSYLIDDYDWDVSHFRILVFWEGPTEYPLDVETDGYDYRNLTPLFPGAAKFFHLEGVEDVDSPEERIEDNQRVSDMTIDIIWPMLA
jgi:hypothetical protein